MIWPIAFSAVLNTQQNDWTLTYEKTNFAETGRYQEALDFCRRLDAASPNATVIELGNSPEGRPMIMLVLSKDKRWKMGERKKPLVYLQNGIHSGEIEGKDACLALAREIVLPNREKPGMRALLDKIDIAILPVFSIDAHERMSAFNRINQNGPTEMGWRATAQNFNLNRDYVKADSAEMENLLNWVKDYDPDFMVDNHTTDGGDWQYALQYDVPRYPTMDEGVRNLSQQFVDFAMPKMDSMGHLNCPYFGGFDQRNPSRGLTISWFGPRYSTGYFVLRNTPSLLVETHVLKDYRTRWQATYDLNQLVLEWCAANADQLVKTRKEAGNALGETNELALGARNTRDSEPFVFKGLVYDGYTSEISGGEIPRWTREKIDIPTTIREKYEPTTITRLPMAYLIPRAQIEVVNRLKLHGVKMTQVGVSQPTIIDLPVTKFSNVTFAASPFEGRFQPRFQLATDQGKVKVHPGDFLVDPRQPLGRLIMHMLEPGATDSFVNWGILNPIFEEKEYAEAYAMEPYAKKMLNEDPELKAEFEKKLAEDEEFAKSPGARLRWFYERSPYFDRWLNVYPIVPIHSRPIVDFLSKKS